MIEVSYAIIGGSSTFSISFPEDLCDERIEVISKDVTYPTPYGDSPPLTVFEVTAGGERKRVVTCRMHGWMGDRTRADSSRQIFSVFREMGVTKIYAEGGVGSIATSMKPGDIIIPDDYLDFSLRKDVSISSNYLLIMRDPVCPALKAALIEKVRVSDERKLFTKGVYAVTDGRHFESVAEVRALKTLGADVVGQSFSPEVYLAREIGACYCGIYLVVNFAEGVVKEWDYSEFKGLFFSESSRIAQTLIDAIIGVANPPTEKCGCVELRVNTLLKK